MREGAIILPLLVLVEGLPGSATILPLLARDPATGCDATILPLRARVVLGTIVPLLVLVGGGPRIMLPMARVAALLIVPLLARPITVPLRVRLMGKAGAKVEVLSLSRMESLSLNPESRERER